MKIIGKILVTVTGKIFVILIVLALLSGAFRVAKYKYYEFKNENAINNAMLEVKEKADEIIIQDNSERTYSEKATDASQRMMSERLKNLNKNKASDKEKERFAAGAFAGQYLRIVVFTKDYCNSLGVDTSELSKTYKIAHRDLHRKAVTILKEAGVKNIQEFSEGTRDSIIPYIKQEVLDIQKIHISQGNKSFTLADSCKYYNQVSRDPEAMKNLAFSEVSPGAYRILMNSE